MVAEQKIFSFLKKRAPEKAGLIAGGNFKHFYIPPVGA
jgi:hypothetical protein